MNNSLDKSFYRKLIVVALPIAFQSLISASLTLLDNLMVSSLGEQSLSAVGLATQTFQIQWMLIFGFCTGCQTFYSQFWGTRDLNNIKKVLGLALATCFGISMVFALIAFFAPVWVLSLFTTSHETAVLGAIYLKTAAINFLLVALIQPLSAALRATQQTDVPMRNAIAAFITDAAFNYILIFGKFGFPRLGVQGAALATVLARVVELLLTLIAVFAKKNVIAGTFSEYFSFDRVFAFRVYKNAIVTTINETMWSAAIVAQNAAFGRMGITEFAALQASRTVTNLFQLACYSLGDASLILVGEQLGQNNIEEGRNISKKIMKACFVVALLMTTLLIVFNKPVLSWFNLSELGAFYGRRLLIVWALTLPMNTFNAILISGVLRSGGDTSFAAKTEVSIMWIYSVPAAFFFALFMKLPVYWVLFLVQMEGVPKLIILLRRYMSGKWLNNVIEGM